jgi:ABC-type transport system involved in cytochrome bd biosynthesis fused ATPase/permease subunit
LSGRETRETNAGPYPGLGLPKPSLRNLGRRKAHTTLTLLGIALGVAAIVTEPIIVLADESTGNLDTRTGVGVLRLLRRACHDRGQTIVMVTHNPRAASHADRILFLKDGQVAGETCLAASGDSNAILHRLAELEM